METLDITDLDAQKKFEVKLHISLINYAERIMPEYKDKKGDLNEYISEQVSKIRLLLNISSENFKILENDEIIFKK
ncbi:MAG: hypothetical protein ACP5NL_03765 [Thermoplasmata archaeon]